MTDAADSRSWMCLDDGTGQLGVDSWGSVGGCNKNYAPEQGSAAGCVCGGVQCSLYQLYVQQLQLLSK
jgi:hypothetical protein